MSTKTVYLISGANRGIGYGLVEILIKRQNAIVFGGARDPSNSKALNELASKNNNLHIIKLTSGSKEDNEAAIAEIESKVGQLDVIIANAGISNYVGELVSTPVEEFKSHYEVNTIGPVVLFQAAHKLLLKSPSGVPIFALISSAVGSIGAYMSMKAAAYGSSKAAANFLIKVLDDEHAKDGLVAMAISPGWVNTDMGHAGAIARGLKGAPVTVQDSINGIMSRIDGATREKSSGRFWRFKDSFAGYGDPSTSTAELAW